jgi:hypothetical protein
MNTKVTKQGAREARAQRILIGCGVLGGVIGAGAAALEAMNIAIPRPLLAAVVTLGIPLVGWATWVYWRNVDEAAREAHKFAWFWGGSGGMLLGLPIMILTTSAKLEALFGSREPSEWVMGGLLAMLVLQLVGYGLVWAGWWLIRQR